MLIGLEDWRTDVTMMAYHLRYLQKHYWKTKYSVNFPRMRPAENEGFQPNVIMSDKELAQVTFAMRIFDHDVDISYSTREPANIRDHMASLGVTTMSAESKTEPGGYYTYPQALEQFHVSDERTAVEIEKALKALDANRYGRTGMLRSTTWHSRTPPPLRPAEKPSGTLSEKRRRVSAKTPLRFP